MEIIIIRLNHRFMTSLAFYIFVFLFIFLDPRIRVLLVKNSHITKCSGIIACKSWIFKAIRETTGNCFSGIFLSNPLRTTIYDVQAQESSWRRFSKTNLSTNIDIEEHPVTEKEPESNYSVWCVTDADDDQSGEGKEVKRNRSAHKKSEMCERGTQVVR